MSNEGLLGSIVTELTPNDVILGKGFRCREYCGTKQFHRFIRQHVEEYDSATSPKEKNAVAEEILSSITELDPPGRFLRELSKEQDAERDVQTKQGWIVLDNAAVLKKIKQALRDSRLAQNKPAKIARAQRAVRSIFDGPRLLQPLLPKLPFLQQQYEAHPQPSESIVRLLRDFDVPEAPMSSQFTTSSVEQQESRQTAKRVREVESSTESESSSGSTLPSSSLFSEGTFTHEEEETAQQLLGLLMSTEPYKPALTEVDVLREKEALMEEEKVVVLSDMFGDMCEITGQTGKRLKRLDNCQIDELLAEMRQKVDIMPPERKSALLLAMRRASPREFDDGRLKLFLHREDMNPEKAAHRFVRYWEERRNIFGEDKYFLPLTLNGALRGDQAALEAGILQSLPGLDVSGRQVLYFCHKNRVATKGTVSTLSALRAVWYVYEASFEHESISKGLVHIIDVQDASLFDVDMEFGDKLASFGLNALPFSNCSSHFCGFSQFSRSYVLPLFRAQQGKEQRLRTVIHDCPADGQLVAKMGKYGIPPNIIPTEIGGKCELNHSQWLASRRAAGK